MILKDHKFGDQMNARLKFSLKAARLCSQFSQTDQLTRHFDLQSNAVKTRYKGPEPTFLPDEIDEHRQFKAKALYQDISTACEFCSSSLRKTFKLKPKPKTSRTIIRLMKQFKNSDSTINKGSNFRKLVLSNYFNGHNKLKYRCPTCKIVTVSKGEKRSDSSFIDRHSAVFKQRRQLRKQRRQEQQPIVMANLQSVDQMEFNPSLSSPSTVTCSSSSSPVSYGRFRPSLSKNTKSPMQTFKANREVVGVRVKAVVKPRVTSNHSGTIIRKFQQQKVNQLMKSKSMSNSKPVNKASALESFLNSMK